MKDSLFARSLAVVSAAALTVAVVVLTLSLSIAEKTYIRSNAEGLERAAWASAAFVPKDWADPTSADQVMFFCTKASANSGYRVTLIDASGRVLGDSGADPASMDNHSGRPEVAGALVGQASWSRRLSATTGTWMLYAAIPLRGPEDGTVTGALRLALPLPGLMASLGDAKRSMILAALAAALVRILDRPVVLLAEHARRLAAGEAKTGPIRIAPKSIPSELKILEASLDSLAGGLTRKAEEAEALGRRFSAILDSAGEAILALDSHLKVIEANPAAHTLLGAKPGSLPGRLLPPIAGTSALVSIAERCLTSGAAITEDVNLYPGNEKTVRVNASLLGGAGALTAAAAAGEASGIVLAVTDISVLKRLETMRTDFVANVSHELRTPIHLIRGFAETLRAGGQDAAETDRHLEIIERNALRMERIVEDLLSLARLERDPSGWLSMESCSLEEIGRSAFENVIDQAEARSVKLESHIPPDLALRANPGLVEQALTNLLENAVRYSPEGSAVLLEAQASDGTIELSVRDRGSGIPAPDLQRIFERFYRADKSRDRKSGGTGLGLAIVRHIALAHGGSVHAESWSGEGSVFTIRLPAPK
jgi:two-component system phosphate regulon sensor histidine kinase PhoR